MSGPTQKSSDTETLQLAHLVDGAWSSGDDEGRDAVSTNPARPQQVVAAYRTAGPRLVNAAIDAARQAQPTWERVGLIERGLILRRAAEILRDRSERIAAPDDRRGRQDPC